MKDDAREFLEAVIPHLDHGDYGVGFYEYWVTDREAGAPGLRERLAAAARLALTSTNIDLLCSAIQALGVTGDERDIPLIENLTDHSDAAVVKDAFAVIKYIRHKMKSMSQLLDEVTDCESFVAYAHALAAERERAEQLEHQNPELYKWQDALGWANRSISQFIGAGLTHFGNRPDDQPLTWKDLAEFLFHGKIIE